MLKTIEGDKPQLSLVPATTPAPTYEDYASRVARVVQILIEEKLKGMDMDLPMTLKMLDPSKDNGPVRDWLVSHGLLTRPRFDRLMAGIARNKKIEDELGFVPKDVLDFVRRYAAAQRIVLTPRGTINRCRDFVIADRNDRPVDAVTIHNRDTSPETRLIHDVANAEGDNLDSFGRELRLTADRLELGYHATIIGDAMQTWQEETTRQQKVDAMLAIQYAKGLATGPTGVAMWDAMERACFDVSATAPGFATAVIKKFMWQVKRKARNLSVTNHLMPVLTGAQGKGKTEFVKAMSKPLLDFRREVDFEMLTDGKTTDIWGAMILFIDEMGFFSKADVDKVKNVITTDNLSIRTMRQNHSAVIRNCATLIGCSNKALDLLIRDDTGVRRFAELTWRNDPDWEASNAIDWKLLWTSVDEHGEDPVIAAGLMGTLREQQEANRNQHPVEVWAREYAHTFKNGKRAQDLHSEYRTWEQDAFPRMDTSVTVFGKTLTALIKSMPDFPLEKSQGRTGVTYRAAKRGGGA